LESRLSDDLRCDQCGLPEDGCEDDVEEEEDDEDRPELLPLEEADPQPLLLPLLAPELPRSPPE
jgi:hypothetical protein